MTEYSDLHWGKNTNGHTKGYMYYYDGEGKRRQISKTSNKKKVSEAKEEIREWADGVRRQGQNSLSLGTKHNGKTIEQVVREYLDFQLSRGKLEKSSYVSQINACSTNAFPYIGGIAFTELNKDAIESWITALFDKKLKVGTIHGVYAHIAKVYKYWYRQNEIRYNPFEFVDTPSKSETKKSFLDKSQMDKLFDSINDYCYVESGLYMAVQLAALAGLRRGEICGLRWYDVDLNEGTLTITSAIGIAEQPYTKKPKNRSSERKFPIVPQLVEILEARKNYVKEEYGTISESWFVCGKANKYLSPTHLSRLFKKFVDEYELVDHYNEEVRLHSLRHNFAFSGVQAKMDIASLSRMMGHASRSMTLDTYADASPEAMARASERLRDRFGEETDYLNNWVDTNEDASPSE